MRKLWLLVLGNLLVLPLMHPAAAQHRPDCRRCKVLLREIWRLDTNSTYLTFWPRTVVGSRSHFYMVSLPKEVPFRVDRNGKREQLLGRSGAGPGEFLAPTAIAVDGALNVHVFDRALGRRQVFDSNLKLLSASTAGASAVIAALVLPSGSTVVNMALRGSGDSVNPLHLLDRAGKLTKSFGGTIAPPTAEGRSPNDLFIRRLAPALRGGFWVAHSDEPIVEEYDVVGKQVRRTTVASPLFIRRPRASFTRSSLVRGRLPSGSSMVGLWESGGNLVVVFLVPTGVVYEGSNRWGVFRTAVQIIDPVSGSLRGGDVFEGEAIAVPEPGVIAMYSEEDGQPILITYRAEITQR